MRKLRRKKVAIDDRLIELFRAAVPASEALWYDATHNKRRMTDEQHSAACAVLHEFEKAIDCKPWDRGPLDDPEPGSHWASLRDALFAECERQDRSAKT